MKTAEMSLSLGLIAVFIVRVVGGGVATHAEASVLPPASPSPSVSVAITHPPDGGVVAGPDVVVRLAINGFPPPADVISAEAPPPPNASLLVVRRRLCRRPRRCWAAVGYYRRLALALSRERGGEESIRQHVMDARRRDAPVRSSFLLPQPPVSHQVCLFIDSAAGGCHGVAALVRSRRSLILSGLKQQRAPCVAFEWFSSCVLPSLAPRAQRSPCVTFEWFSSCAIPSLAPRARSDPTRARSARLVRGKP